MLPEELKNLVSKIVGNRTEMQNIELKKAGEGTPKLYDTLSSFSNQTGGGIIIFGIDEEQGFKVVGVYDAQELQKKVVEQSLQMSPVIRPVLTVAEIGQRIVVSAEIAECDIFDKPCFYTGAGRLRGSYIRVGDADLRMTEYEIYSYEAFKRKFHDELRAVERAGEDSLDKNYLADYLGKIRLQKPNLARLSDEKILQLQGITENGRPTLAGIMMLGEYPQAFFPQLSITAMVVAGTEIGELGSGGERFIDNQRIEGTLPQMLQETLAFVRRNIKIATVIEADGRRADKSEYPLMAIRELILNALIHRDYSIYTDSSPIRVVFYTNRLEIESPGGLYGRITLDDLGKVAADTRNPFIAGGMEILSSNENRFSGIPIVRSEMKNNNLPPPVFEVNRGVFKATLFNKQTAEAQRHEPRKVKGSVENEILAFCTQPRSREEISRKVNINSSSYLYRRYLRPLIEAGSLRLTLPDAPKSKLQRYVSTVKSEA